jgi:hypothetical protein
MNEGRHGNLRTRHDGFKPLVVLFKSSSIDIRHIIGKDLHLAFLRQSAGKDGIDGSVHVCLSKFDSSTMSHRNRHATNLPDVILCVTCAGNGAGPCQYSAMAQSTFMRVRRSLSGQNRPAIQS